MTIEIRFPSPMGHDEYTFTEGEVEKVLVNVGDRVHAHQSMVNYHGGKGFGYGLFPPHAATVLAIHVSPRQIVHENDLGVILVKTKPKNLTKAINKLRQNLHPMGASTQRIMSKKSGDLDIRVEQEKLVRILQKKPENSTIFSSSLETWAETKPTENSSSCYSSSSYSKAAGFTQSKFTSKLETKTMVATSDPSLSLVSEAEPKKAGSSINKYREDSNQEFSNSPKELKMVRKNIFEDIENSVSDMKLDMLAHLFIQRLTIATNKDFTGKAKNNLINLHNVLRDQFETHQFGDLDRLAQTSAKVQRINEYETVMDAYERKIKAVRNDPDLGTEDREEKLEYWKRLRDRDVSAFESGGA